MDPFSRARLGVAHPDAGFDLSWIRSLDQEKEEPGRGYLNLDCDGHLAGIVAPVRLRTV